MRSLFALERVCTDCMVGQGRHCKCARSHARKAAAGVDSQGRDGLVSREATARGATPLRLTMGKWVRMLRTY